jgi:hypothetical protein
MSDDNIKPVSGKSSSATAREGVGLATWLQRNSATARAFQMQAQEQSQTSYHLQRRAS